MAMKKQNKINYSRRGKCMAQTITQEEECLNFTPATSKNHEQVCEYKAENGKCSRGEKMKKLTFREVAAANYNEIIKKEQEDIKWEMQEEEV
jgi:hypothetical protein